MVKENKREEKLCLFFASDYHFEMIILPYINESLKSDKNVIVITENDLNETVNKLLTNVNLSQEDKEKIAKIDWKNDDVNKFREIKSIDGDRKETVIFVKGKKNYINSINKNIEKCMNISDAKVIDCYDINEVHDVVGEIAEFYGGILSTSGVERLLD